MSYIKPELVVSPKSMVKNLKVIYDDGENSWALAHFDWDEKSVLGLRWNGGSNDPRFPGIGNPQSRGVPTWFVLPDEIGEAILKMLQLSKKLNKS